MVDEARRRKEGEGGTVVPKGRVIRVFSGHGDNDSAYMYKCTCTVKVERKLLYIYIFLKNNYHVSLKRVASEAQQW